MTTKPTPPRAAGRPARQAAPDVKLLVTAAALASTLGGWAALSRADAMESPAASGVAPAADGGAESLSRLLTDLPPVPTVEPLPTDALAVPAHGSAGAPPRPAPAAAAPAPTPQLRVVTVPPPAPRAPRPVAVTRSSR